MYYGYMLVHYRSATLILLLSTNRTHIINYIVSMVTINS